jgi:hypothetical protein
VLRLIPLPEHNLITFALAYPPEVELKLEAAVGHFGAQLGNFSFLKRAIQNVLNRRFTEPRRRMLAQYVKPPRMPNILQGFTSAVITASVQSIDFGACQQSEVVVHAQVRKVRVTRTSASVLMACLRYADA